MSLSSCKNWIQSFKYNVDALRDGIDVVYTWVDGSDAKFLTDFNRYHALEINGDDPFVGGKRRFRDNDEIRYSLRSIETNAPWINRVFIVTCGQVPSWLNLKHPRLHLVNHAEIFPDPNHLPTFNSLGIEAHLHRIPGLSKHFLYFNDDMFLGRSVSRNDFLQDDGIQKIRVEWWALPELEEGDLPARVRAFNHHLLKKQFGDHSFFSVAHVPCFYNRKRISEVQKIWQKEFAVASSTRFRTAKAAQLHVLYAHYQIANKRAEYVLELEENYQFIAFKPPLEEAIKLLDKIRELRPKFFVINDDWDGPCEIKGTAVRDFLEGYFPKSSSFEK